MEMTSTMHKLVKGLVRTLRNREKKMARTQRNITYQKGQRMACM